jgi:hypothetical protein
VNDEELERELERLTPALPPPALLRRLQRPRSKIISWWWTAPLAAAAAITLALFPHRDVVPHRPAATPVAETFVPAERDEYLLSAQDLGVVELRPGAPYRLVHCVWADEETFRSERRDARLEVRQARAQIIPVALELF